MLKLITPPGMLLTVALLAIYSISAFMIGWIEDSWPLRIGGALAVIASYGVAMLRPWSRYLVYLLTTGFMAKLAHSVWYAHVAGFFDFQFVSAQQSVASLLPSIALVVLSLMCCYFVHKHFANSTGS